jgi:hypothetical protein
MPERLACRGCGTDPVLPRTTTGTPAVARGTRDRRRDARRARAAEQWLASGSWCWAEFRCEASTGSESAYRLGD